MFTPLLSVEHLFKNAWHLYRTKTSKLAQLQLFHIISMIIFSVGLIPAIAAFSDIWTSRYSTGIESWHIMMGLFTLTAFFIAYLFSLWVMTASLHMAYLDENSVGEAMKKSMRHVSNMFLLSIVRGFVIVVGFIFFIIPGIIFTGWFSYAEMFVVRGKGPIDAMKSSYELVDGRWFPVSLRLLCANLILGLAQLFTQVVPTPDGEGAAAMLAMAFILVALIIYYVLYVFFMTPWYLIFKRVLIEDLEHTKHANA